MSFAPPPSTKIPADARARDVDGMNNVRRKLSICLVHVRGPRQSSRDIAARRSFGENELTENDFSFCVPALKTSIIISHESTVHKYVCESSDFDNVCRNLTHLDVCKRAYAYLKSNQMFSRAFTKNRVVRVYEILRISGVGVFVCVFRCFRSRRT